MTTTEDETKEHEFDIDKDQLNEFIRLFTKVKKKSMINAQIQSSIEFLESQGYKVIKN